jgi:hypothetical protein
MSVSASKPKLADSSQQNLTKAPEKLLDELIEKTHKCSSHCTHSSQIKSQAKASSGIWDKLGMASSVLCAIHCLSTPILLGLFLTLQASNSSFEPKWESIDKICLFLAPIFAFFSLRHGLRVHGSIWPSGVFSCGFVLLILGVFVFEHAESSVSGGMAHYLSMVFGGLCIALSHLLNLHFNNKKAASI